MTTTNLWSPGQPSLRPPQNALLFVMRGNEHLGAGIARLIGLEPAPLEERDFEDGEHKSRPLVPVAGRHVAVLNSLHGGPSQSANDKLCRLLFLTGALRDAGAASVTALVPYLCYARKDRRTKASDPVTTRSIAKLFEAVGVDTVLTLEVHNDAAFENAFRIRAITLSASVLFIPHLVGTAPHEKLVVMTPDAGGAKRAELLRGALQDAIGREVGFAIAEKHRSQSILTGGLFAGDVRDARVVIIDDMISTGHTVERAARSAKAAGAIHVAALTAHGLFVPECRIPLQAPSIDQVVTTDSVTDPDKVPAEVKAKLQIIPCAPLFAEALGRIFCNEALADLLVF